MHAAADIAKAVGEILAEADANIASRRPVCRASGRCCKFEEYGHRLYVTAAEMMHFSWHGRPAHDPDAAVSVGNIGGTPIPRPRVSLPQFFATESPAGCPYQVEGLCIAREARPLGCRLYFCAENAQSWQSEVYEKYHARLVAVHERFGLPYRYMEWREALRELL